MGKKSKEIKEAEARIINDMATTEDEVMAAYGFAIDSGYQGSFEDYKAWRMKRPEFDDREKDAVHK